MKNEQGKSDVKAAFELLTDTLEDERKRIFQAGSQAMERQDVQVAQAVLDFARKLNDFHQNVKSLMVRWDEMQAANDIAPQQVQDIVTGTGKLFTKTHKSKSGFSRQVNHPLAPKTNFTVTFPDGTIIAENKAADGFAKAIGRIGSTRVMALGLIMNGEPLVLQKPGKKYEKFWRETGDGFYVSTQNSTESKIKYLNHISKLLNLGLLIEQVSEKDSKNC
ncbi:MAG: hypothetical protein ACI4WT_11430 [Oligosphaeraceae bacterium]